MYARTFVLNINALAGVRWDGTNREEIRTFLSALHKGYTIGNFNFFMDDNKKLLIRGMVAFHNHDSSTTNLPEIELRLGDVISRDANIVKYHLGEVISEYKPIDK